MNYFKKILLCLLLTFVFKAGAQTDTLWTSGGAIAFNFNQVSFTNWAAGGENALAGNLLASLYSNYKNEKWAWDNSASLAFGGAKTGDQEIRKSDDKIELISKAGYAIGKNFFISYLLDFKTQFTEGFEYHDTLRSRISGFMAPAYILNSLGIDWKPKEDLSFFLSPLTLKTTVLNDVRLSEEGQFGVNPGKTIRHEAGALFVARHDRKLMENVLFNTRIEFFSSYAQPRYVDVHWDLVLGFKVNKYIAALISLQMIYDDDVSVPKSDITAPPGPALQFKQLLGLGASYNFERYTIR